MADMSSPPSLFQNYANIFDAMLSPVNSDTWEESEMVQLLLTLPTCLNVFVYRVAVKAVPVYWIQ